MAITAAEAVIINKALAGLQKANLGTEYLALQARVAALESSMATAEASITDYSTGVGITLPTTEPATAGSLWGNTLIVTVGDGT
jgi:hypothetical protein